MKTHKQTSHHAKSLAHVQEQEGAQVAEQSQNQAVFDQALARWLAPRFLRYPRTKMWFAIMFATCAALGFYAVQTEAWTMLAVFLALPVVLLLEHRHEPENVEVVISEYGIRYGEIRVPYSQIKKFWISHHPPMVDELHLVVDSRWMPEVIVPLMGNDPAKLRQFLVTQIPEWEGKTLSMADVVTRLLRLN